MTRLFRDILNHRTLSISPPLLKALIRFHQFPAHNIMASQSAAQGLAMTPEPKWKRNTAYVKPDEQLGERDTTLIKDFLPEPIAVDAFEKLKEEVQWMAMHHHGEHAPAVRFLSHQATQVERFHGESSCKERSWKMGG